MDTLILIACLFVNDTATCSMVPETELRILSSIVLIADSTNPAEPKIISSSKDIKSKPTTSCPGSTPLASFLCRE